MPGPTALRIERHDDIAIAGRVVGFTRFLRDQGYPVGVNEGLDTLKMIEMGDWRDAAAVHHGLKALLCATTTDWERFDDLFEAYWHRRGLKRQAQIAGSSAESDAPTIFGAASPADQAGPPDRVERGPQDDDDSAGPRRKRGASAAENLAAADLRHIHDKAEMALVNDLAERLARRMRYRLTRRHRIARRGRRLDLRKVIHKSIRYGGEPLELAFRKRRLRPPRLVVLVDASGSMSQYSAFFVRFIAGVIKNFRQAEAFIFHTRLIHLSNALKERDATKAAERLGIMSQGWAGGTKIGESLATFNRAYAPRILNSRSIVIIVSDGYDTGDPAQLGVELARIQKRARRIIWLNPMIGWDGYEPVAGGMAAALPHIDLFAPAHNLESLAALEPYLSDL